MIHISAGTAVRLCMLARSRMFRWVIFLPPYVTVLIGATAKAEENDWQDEEPGVDGLPTGTPV